MKLRATRLRRIAAGLLLPLAFSFGAAAQPPTIEALDAQLATVGHRLAVANTARCADQQWHAGFAIHHASQYARAAQTTLQPAFAARTGPAVLALARGGPAERAGLRPDDLILAADGSPLPAAPRDAFATFIPAEQLLDALDAAFADGRARLRLRRGGQDVDIDIVAERGCASRFQIVPGTRIRAGADGRYVQLTSAIAAFAGSDEELAALVSHELAHNILQHRRRLNAAGVDRGVLRHFGRNARLFRETEAEADRMSVHLMAAAGYSPHAALRFWQRHARLSGPFSLSTTHPSWDTRLAMMAAEVRAIEVRAIDGALPPAQP